MEEILTNQNLIDGAACYGHTCTLESVNLRETLNETVTWQQLELLVPLAQISSRVTLTGTLRASKAYTDTVQILREAWPDLEIIVTQDMVRGRFWNPKVYQAAMEQWETRLPNENRTIDGLIIMSGFVDRAGESTSGITARSLDSGSMAVLDSLDLSGLGEISLSYTDGTGTTHKIVSEFLPGLETLNVSGTSGLEPDLISGHVTIETFNSSGSYDSFVLHGNTALNDVHLGSPEYLDIEGCLNLNI